MPEPGADQSGDAGLRGRDLINLGGLLAAAVIAGCVAAALAAIVPSRTEIPGLPTAGTITEVALPAVTAVFHLSAALTVGWLLAAAWLVPPQRSGFLDVGGYRAIRAASIAANSLSASVRTSATFSVFTLAWAMKTLMSVSFQSWGAKPKTRQPSDL